MMKRGRKRERSRSASGGRRAITPSPGMEGKFIDNKPIQVLATRRGTGKPFADNCFITLVGETAQFLKTAGVTDSCGRHMRLTPAGLVDLLGDASTTVQPLYYDQLYAIWNESIVARATVEWWCRPTDQATNDFTEEGYYMIMVNTPGQAEDTIINAATLTAAGARGPELLRHNTSGAQIKWRYVKPSQMSGVTGRMKISKLTIDVDMAKVLGVTATEYLETDDNYYIANEVYATTSPHTHCYIMTGNGTAWTSTGTASTTNRCRVTAQSIFKNLKDVAQSVI